MTDFFKWCDTATRQVRFFWDRGAIAAELTAHYEDHVKDLERIGFDHALALERALGAMGDAEEVGRALDRVHKPLLGWLWLVSKWGVLFCLLVTLCAFGSNLDWFSRFTHPSPRDGQYENDGSFHFSPDSWEHEYSIQVLTGTGDCVVERSGDTWSVPYAVVWKCTYPGDDRDLGFTYYWTMVALDHPHRLGGGGVMRILRLTRRQKLLRNLLVIAVLLFCVEWRAGFPAWRMETLVRRAEDACLLEPVTSIWLEDVDQFGRPVLYGENNGQLISIVYEDGLLGKNLEDVTLYQPGFRYIMDYRTESDGDDVSRTARVIGFLNDAQRMELELTVQDVHGEQGTLTLEGTKENDHCFTFASTPEETPAAGILWTEELTGSGVLRIYDGAGVLQEERVYDTLSFYFANEKGGAT